MKRILTLLFSVILCFSLVACGESKIETTPYNTGALTNTESEISKTDPLSDVENEVNNVLDKNDTTNYIGVWETAHYRLTITKGGVGRYEELKENAGHYELNWEVKDEVLVTQISFFGMEHKAVLELSDDASSLVVLQYGFPAYVESEDTFTKQP